jgi:peroxiredoxin
VIQLGELEKRMAEITTLADVVVVNVDHPDNSRWLKESSKISAPVLLDNELRVTTMYDMHSRPGLPMGGMSGIPTMGFVIADSKGIVRVMRAHIYFGQDGDYIINTLKTL